MFNEKLVNELNKGYGFKCRVFPYALHITSKCDEWIAEFVGDKLILKHINKNNAKTRSHTQRIYLDLSFMFKSISSHDEFKDLILN